MSYQHHRDHGVEKAIEGAIDGIVEHVLWHLEEGKELTRDRVQELISDADWSETAAIGLSLEQKLEAIEEGVDITGDSGLSFTLDDLRTELESYAVQAIHWLAEAASAQHFEDLFDFMDEHGLEPEQMRTDNGFGWLIHVAEREVEGAVIYEYRNVEGSGNHVDVWEISLAGHRIHFEVRLDSE